MFHDDDNDDGDGSRYPNSNNNFSVRVSKAKKREKRENKNKNLYHNDWLKTNIEYAVVLVPSCCYWKYVSIRIENGFSGNNNIIQQ